jgi:hypothetical protein
LSADACGSRASTPTSTMLTPIFTLKYPQRSPR